MFGGDLFSVFDEKDDAESNKDNTDPPANGKSVAKKKGIK